jgi:Cu/Ag efflux pump CusA
MATLILLLAVVPLLFAEGRLAILLQSLAVAYIAAILASMVTALTVTPALSALLLAKAPLTATRGRKLTDWLQSWIERRSAFAARSPKVVYSIALLALLVSSFAWTRLERDLLPNFKETDILVEWRGPEGIALPEMTRVTSSLIRDLRALPGVQNAAAHVGRAVLCNCDDAEDVNSATVWVSIDPQANYAGTLASIRATVADYPGMSARVGSYLSKKVRDAVADDPRQLTVRVYGQNHTILREKAAEIRQLLAQVNGVSAARVEDQAEEAIIEIEADLEKAGNHGFKPGDVRRATASLVGGITVGALFEQQKVFDVVVWGSPDVRKNIADIQNLQLETDGGNLVRLSEIAEVRLAPATSTIRRQGALRRLDIQADVDGRAVGAVAQDVAERLKSVSFPLEYHARVLDEHLYPASILRSVESYAVAAGVLAFLLLQAAFGSWRLAAAALLGLPLVVLGSLVAILLDGRVITLGSILGCVAVLGLTLRISMATIKQFQILEREGLLFGEELIRRGFEDRFRSTTAALITTGAIMLPFILLGNGAGLEIAHPMGISMLGALVGAVPATLLLTPALYQWFGAGTAADQLDLESAPNLESPLQ